MLPLPDLFAAVRWWAVLMLIGLLATPLAYFLFRPLADRGYAFSKMLGLLVVSYLFWILGSLGFVGNNVGGILLALLLLAGLSGWAVRHAGWAAFRAWVQSNQRQIWLTEIVFTAVFLLWVFVRAQNPAIAATEKPMEFAFLNAVSRSPTFPPLDPWLSGFGISYYYFGYVMTSLLARLALVPEAIAFNLGLAWLVAGTVVGAFGLVFNLIAIGDRRLEIVEGSHTPHPTPYAPRRLRSARLLGILAALALPLAGNLVILLEIAHGNGVGSDSFWAWLDVRDLNGPAVISETPRYESSQWWWWRTSRVIHEYHLSGRAEEGLEPIVEIPAFSFVLGDMHPHVLALPFALLSLAVALVWYLRASGAAEEQGSRGAEEHSPLHPRTPAPLLDNIQQFIQPIGWPLYLLTLLILGGLSFLNTWDVLIHLFVVLGAFALGRWQTSKVPPISDVLGQTGKMAVLLVLPAIILYLPFYFGFRSQAGAPYLLPFMMRPTRLAHFLLIFGMPLLPITILMARLLWRQRGRQWQVGVLTAVSLLLTLLLLMLFLGWLIASSAEGAGRVLGIADELGLLLPPRPDGAFALGWGLTAVFSLIPALLSAKLAYSGVTLLLLFLLGSIVMVWKEAGEQGSRGAGEKARSLPTTLPFTLLLIATAALLTLGPEFVYLRDNFGFRLNTTFKFYYQAWLMFGIAALVSLDYLWQLRPRRQTAVVPALASAGYAALLAVALLFPIYAVRSRTLEYRGAVGENRQPATLDGQAQRLRFNADEVAAIDWLRANGSSSDVVLEAVGGQYSEFGRISASTGIPTVLGWAGHELQWRGSSNPEPGRRDPLVRDIYTQLNLDNVAGWMDELGVTYIYVGPLEHTTYGSNGMEKFAEQLPVVYQNNSVTIYRWEPRG